MKNCLGKCRDTLKDCWSQSFTPDSVSANSGVELDAQACLCSLATCINPVVTTDNAKWLICVDTVYNHFSDSLTAGKEKARERSEQELGASVASIGGRAQWVKRAAQAASAKRVCGAVVVGGDRQ